MFLATLGIGTAPRILPLVLPVFSQFSISENKYPAVLFYER